MRYVAVVFLFLLLSGTSFAESVLTVEKDLTLLRGQEFTVPKPSFGAFTVGNDRRMTIRVEGNKVTFSGIGKGESIVQVLHVDGTITNYRIQMIPTNKNSHVVKRTMFKGYNFIWSSSYYQTKAPSQTIDGFRSQMVLTTKVGSQGKFYGRVEYNENYPTYFYVRGDYKKVYAGYGDLQLQLNPYKPSFITQPRLRQSTAGWDGEKFDLDLWSGQISPILSSRITQYSPNSTRENLLLSPDDKFSGGRVRYRFEKGDSIYASYWYNHQQQRDVPYVGYTYVNRKWGVSNSITVGNSQEAPVFANAFSFDNRERAKWNLKELNVNYEVAKKGYDNLLYLSNLPLERFAIGGRLYGGGKNSIEGSTYINLGYGYNLNGYTTSNIYSGKVGWQNSRVKVGVGGFTRTQEFTYAPGEVFNSNSIAPELEILFNPKGETWRWRLKAEQEYQHQETIVGFTDRQETKLTLSAKHNLGWNLSMGVSRFNTENQSNQTNGFRLQPRAEYRKDNVLVYVQGNTSYVDPVGINSPETSYDLAQERYSAGLKYSHNKQHIFEGRYLMAQDQNSQREYSTVYVGYTLKLGHPSKSIISLLDSKKISGVIYDDLNLNGVQDNNEKGVEGIQVVVQSSESEDKKYTRTDSQGFYKISGLKDESYYFVMEDKTDFTLSSMPGNLNFKVQEAYEYNLPAIKTKNVEVVIKGSVEGLIAEVNCQDKPSFNRALVDSGKSTILTVPSKNNCTVSLELVGKSNLSVYPLEHSVDKKVLEFDVSQSKVLLGQVFWDKNKNGKYDFGEELSQKSVVFDKFNLKTDANGIFSTNVSDKISMVKFLRVPGFKCNLKNPQITDFNSGKIIVIGCIK